MPTEESSSRRMRRKGSCNSSAQPGDQGAGRQSIEIKKIVNEESRQVCFSKRRNGLTKKAAELCILCGAEVAVIIFSPGGKVYSYGHPSIDSIFSRFLDPTSAFSLRHRIDPKDLEATRQLCQFHDELTQQLHIEKQRHVALQKRSQELACTRFGFFWDSDIDELSLEQLEEFAIKLQETRSVLRQRLGQLNSAGNAAAALPHPSLDEGSVNAYTGNEGGGSDPIDHDSTALL